MHCYTVQRQSQMSDKATGSSGKALEQARGLCERLPGLWGATDWGPTTGSGVGDGQFFGGPSSFGFPGKKWAPFTKHAHSLHGCAP